MFGGRAAKRVFLVLRTTGVLTLAGFVSFSATPPLEGGDMGRAELVSLALSLLAPPFIFETSTRNSWRQASTRGGKPVHVEAGQVLGVAVGLQADVTLQLLL